MGKRADDSRRTLTVHSSGHRGFTSQKSQRTATVARLIDPLEAAGWIERKAEAQDRRVKLVTMTEKATSIMDEVGVIGQKLRDDMLIDLSHDEREALLVLLAKIKSRLVRLLETP